MDCVFCKIASGEIPTDAIYEDENLIAFNDLDPQAPIHFLVIPKKHITSLSTLSDSDSQLIAEIMKVIRDLAKKYDLTGYRVVTNIGEEGGQSVPHLHFHVLGGRSFHWPPG
ncbi:MULTISPECIES: histidine triad nucleotide-binding protein [unclassified Anaerococcus]|uniref:histidine triad nucleotide-binding protein n=1 Tax=unclassified Anaerococcus TaxID=2614126 RepID=UPI000C0709F0|nr:MULTISPECIES: histidine triad nucleotide-binding protein [unclassified Anaerococcus]